MAMGICKLPRIVDYWSTTHPLITPNIRDVMTLVRFEQLCRYLDLITPKLESEYNPCENLASDEAMIPFKERLHFKQYIKDKPTKWGIKVFVLADSKNGYVYQIQIYAGKNSELSTHEQGLSTKVVFELLEGLENKGYKVFIDNYCTSPHLFLVLHVKG